VAANSHCAQETQVVREEEKAKDKLPSQWWPKIIGILMDYCEAPNEVNLPKEARNKT